MGDGKQFVVDGADVAAGRVRTSRAVEGMDALGNGANAGTGVADAHSFASTHDDGRSCTACSCSPEAGSCSLTVEVCSVGFYDVTLQSAFGACEQLNSSDGDGLNITDTSFTGTSACDPSGGVVTGTVELSGITTVCCAE